jgi:hypothetical protein
MYGSPTMTSCKKSANHFNRPSAMEHPALSSSQCVCNQLPSSVVFNLKRRQSTRQSPHFTKARHRHPVGADTCRRYYQWKVLYGLQRHSQQGSQPSWARDYVVAMRFDRCEQEAHEKVDDDTRIFDYVIIRMDVRNWVLYKLPPLSPLD